MSRPSRILSQAKALFNRGLSSNASQQSSASTNVPRRNTGVQPDASHFTWRQSYKPCIKSEGFKANTQNLLKVFALRGAGSAFGMVLGGALLSDVNFADALPSVLTDGNAASSGQTPAQEQLRPTGSSGYHQVSHPLGPHYIADAAALAAPAVVNITVTQDGVPIPQDQSGTGFIFTSDGSILTNAHVVADALAERSLSHQNASSSSSSSSSRIRSDAPKPITVALQDGRIFQGSVIMFDRLSDLAVVQIQCNHPLPVVKMGTSKGLRVGEWVLALGSPLHLQNSVTAGIISCVDRKAADLGLSRVCAEYIQTDAAINRGNSGGPLINLQGEVIGLACFKALSADGVSFAIPIDTAKDVVQQLQQRGRVVRPYIGIKMLQLNEHNASQMREKDAAFPAVSQGILVPYVAVGSPAAKCGMKDGDVITGFAGQSSNMSTSHLIHCLGQYVNKKMEVELLRPGVGKKVLQLQVSEALQ